jgi:hypothetical protein
MSSSSPAPLSALNRFSGGLRSLRSESHAESSQGTANRSATEAAPVAVNTAKAKPEVEAVAEPDPEVLSPEARERRAKALCVAAAQDNYRGVDWKFFQNMTAKPAADSMTVTIEGKRETQPYRVVCQVHDGYAPDTHTLYRVDLKSRKASIETSALAPCTTGWTAASVCRPARPVSNAPVVRPGKRLDDAQDQCRLIARSKYPGIEWRTIMGIGSEWFELLGVHGVRTAIEGSRNGQDFRISCFLPDGAVDPVHKLYALHPITGEVTGEVDLLDAPSYRPRRLS